VNFSISPQIRIVALVGLVLVVVAGGASMMLGHSGSSNPSTSQAPLHRHAPPTKVTIKSKNGKTVVKTGHRAGVQHVHRTVVTPKTKATAKAAAKSAAKTKTKTTVVHTKKHTTVVQRSGNLVYADLPAPLQWQLAKHHIVVVSIYNPNSDVDAISVAEAHAGATEAGAGFLLVSVLDNSLAGPLTALLPGGGLLPDPGILIYRSPGNMAMRIDGFVDRDAVAQAASNAFAGQNSPLTSTDSSSSSSGSYGATP
jgi:hypothetical protein